MAFRFLVLVGVACSLLAESQAPSPPSPKPTYNPVAVATLMRLKGMDLEANPTLKATVLRVIKSTEGDPKFVELVKAFKLKDQNEPLLRYSLMRPDEEAGVEAMRMVLQNQGQPLVYRCLEASGQKTTRALVTALGYAGVQESVSMLTDLLTKRDHHRELKLHLIKALSSSLPGARALLAVIEKNQLAEELKATAGDRLSTTPWVEIRQRAVALRPLASPKNSDPLPPIERLARMSGDPGRGEAIFHRESTACAQCHRVNGQGIDFGPNLSEIGAKLGKDAIYESILNPNSALSFGYEAWELEFANGDLAFGVIVSESAEEIAIKQVGGVVSRRAKSDLVYRKKQTISLMPEDLHHAMELRELVDLVEFLFSLKKTK